MWAGSLLLRIGEDRDLLVPIGADTAASLAQLRVLFAPWIDTKVDSKELDVEPLFGVRLESVSHRSGRGVLQPVPQLRYGSAVMARSREPDDILRALAQVLGGAHLYRRDDGRLWMGIRPFVRGNSVVLVDVDRPTMVNDRQLAEAGVTELPVRSTIIEPDGSMSVPAMLPDLDWKAAGVEPASWAPGQFELVGIASLRAATCTTAEFVTALAERSVHARWFNQVVRMAEAEHLAVAATRPVLRERVRRLLGS